MTAFRQSWQVSLRGIRVLVRNPAFLGITLTQPIIWLLLFGALFKAVTQIPGFDGGSYIDFLTPGIVVMLAVSSAGWTGMGLIEDINGGVMDRMLASPAWRGAPNAGLVAYAVLTIVLQSVLIVLLALVLGAHYTGGVGGVLLQILVPAWIRTVARFNPVNWAVQAGRSAAMQKIDWGLVGTRIGLLVAFALLSAMFATRAFTRYQRSL